MRDKRTTWISVSCSAILCALFLASCRFGFEDTSNHGDGDSDLGGASSGDGDFVPGTGGDVGSGSTSSADGGAGGASPSTGGDASTGGGGDTGGSGACTNDCTPTGIDLSGETLTTAYGGDGGDPFSDRCPDGQVLIGFEGYADPKPGEQWIDRIQAVCGTLTLSPSDPYTVTVEEGLALPLRGGGGVKHFSVYCPADSMVFAFEGRSGLLFDQVTLYCAPLEVTGTPGNYDLDFGTFTVEGPAGGSGGSAFPRTDCPPGWVANGIEGSSGSSVDQLGLACAEPVLTY